MEGRDGRGYTGQAREKYRRSSVPRVQDVASEVEPILGLELAEVGEFGVLLLTVTTPVNAANDREGLPPLLPFDIVELFGVGVVLGDFVDPHGESSLD